MHSLEIFTIFSLVMMITNVAEGAAASGESCTATFVTNEGNKFPNTVGVKIDDNTYVFGQNTEGHLKMVAVDSTGAILTRRYGPYIAPENIGPNAVTIERWESGTNGCCYSAEDLNMACVHIAVKTSRFYVDDGCHTEGDGKDDDYAGTYELPSFEAGVRCCSMDGTTCNTFGTCPGKSTYYDAVRECEDRQMKLCTKDELLSEICCYTGGQCDNHQVWTSTLEPACFVNDVDSPGNDIDIQDHISSAAACQDLCKHNTNCRYFLYGSSVHSGRCWLKSKRTTTLTPYKGLIFGPKICGA